MALLLALSPLWADSNNKINLKYKEKTEKTFTPDSLDEVIGSTPLPVGKISSAQANKQNSKKKSSKASRSAYQIQLGTFADFELAQKRKQEYSKHLEGEVKIVFNSPFYKLRFGNYKKRKKAEKKVTQIQALGMPCFIVKL